MNGIVIFCINKTRYLFTQILHHRQDATQGQFLSRVLKDSFRGVVVNCDIVVREFEIQTHFRIVLGKVWTPLSPSCRLNSTTTVLQ